MSLITRSNTSLIKEIFVVINGLSRKPLLQNQKQEFLEELRKISPIPLRLIRTWDYTGHAHCVEQALPFVDTEFYLTAHDDIIVLDTMWAEKVLQNMENPKIAIVAAPPLTLSGLELRKNKNGQFVLSFPHLFCGFVACRRSAFLETGVRWWGHHIEGKFPVPTGEEIKELQKIHKCNIRHWEKDAMYIDVVCQDIGAWALYFLRKAGYQATTFEPPVILHFNAMSWSKENLIIQRIKDNSKSIQKLYNEFKEESEFARLFLKYIKLSLLSVDPEKNIGLEFFEKPRKTFI